MDKATEQIALNFFEAIQQLEEGRNLQKSFRESIAFTPELANAIDASVAKAVENHELAKELFWQAFKYPLQIFDLKKGEKPADREVVIIFDEWKNNWLEVQFYLKEHFNEQIRLTSTVKIFLEDVDRYHRWTRLPILEPEKNDEQQH